MVALIKRLDAWSHRHLTLLLLLLVVIVLRVPNFFEPYWYGDEGIYLTVGNGIKDGEKLYTDIIDHKTPLIYYLATVPNQLSFRFLTLGWMLATTLAFYHFSRKILPESLGVVTASLVFVLLTSLPWFEGNIPNGELFVMGFALMGAWLWSRTTLFYRFVEKDIKIVDGKNRLLLLGSGVVFGLGILTKVPAILDWGAFLFISFLIVVNSWPTKLTFRLFKNVLIDSVIFIGGTVFPILLSIIYFVSVGSGQDYLDYGLLYNFRYASNWGLPFDNPILEWLFTLPGKMAVLGAVLLLLIFGKKRFSGSLQFSAAWFGLALVASLLSNRPYPHYFQQLVPPLALLSGLAIIYLEKAKKHWLELGLIGLLVGLFVSALALLKFAPYKTLAYYTQFVRLLTGQWSVAEYRQSFNHLMNDNYRAAESIRASGVSEIFIWGTNAPLYALSGTQPVGRFTVSFHIKDFKAQTETMDNLKAAPPLFIVTMRDEREDLPGLNQFLAEYYLPNTSFDYFTLWKRADVLGASHAL